MKLEKNELDMMIAKRAQSNTRALYLFVNINELYDNVSMQISRQDKDLHELHSDFPIKLKLYKWN